MRVRHLYFTMRHGKGKLTLCLPLIMLLTTGVISDTDGSIRPPHQDQVCDESSLHKAPGSTEFYVYIAISVGLVLLGGLMSGLTVGIFSIDPLKLELMKVGGSQKIKEQAEKLQPLLNQHHFLLVTLLLTNAAAMEALPIFLDALVPSYIAIILSVTFVLAFGEIIPQALCTKNPLSIGARFAWVVKALMFLLFPIAWPIGKLLDWILGHGEARTILFKRSELKSLVDLHASTMEGPFQLSADEASILKGALDLKKKRVSDSMTHFPDVFMLSVDDHLNYVTMARILASGFSRIPVFSDSPHNIVGLMLVKRLIVVDPEEERPIKHLSLRRPLFISPDTPLIDMLNCFQEGRSHLAIITNDADEYEEYFLKGLPVPAHLKVLGIITIEDVVEEIIQEEIADEDDISVAHEKRVTDLISQKEIGVQRAVKKFKHMLQRRQRRMSKASSQVNSSTDQSEFSSYSMRSPRGQMNVQDFSQVVKKVMHRPTSEDHSISVSVGWYNPSRAESIDAEQERLLESNEETKSET
jgi:CBS domain containing-hemolysin-like protein